MIEPTQAASAATTGGTTAARTAATQSVKSFASVLAKSANTGSSTETTKTEAPARPDGEQTKKVAGHPFSRIINGEDKGLYLNQLAGNPRMGKAFKLLERDDHVFHIYGTGKDRVIVEVKAKSTTDAATTTSTPTTAS